MRISTVVFAAVLGLTAAARAQTPDTPAPPEAVPPAAQPAPAEAAPPAPPPVPPVAAAEPPAAPARYSFNRVDGGFLRLDAASGQVAYCTAHTVGWACESVPEDRAALEKEIARLQDEVATLKSEVAALRAPPPPPRPPADLTPRSGDSGGLKMPSDEDIARARAAVANAWQRLVDMVEEFKKDMMRKVQPSDRTSL